MIDRLRIEGGVALVDGALAQTSIDVSAHDGAISALDTDGPVRRRIDAAGLLVLPGIVDLHSDAFERQIMPRPGVDFPIDIALLDTDRQVVANGITTIYHSVTWSWEPGLRGAENARAIVTALDRLRPQLGADTKFHLRHENYNLVAEPEIAGWLANHRIDLLAFNDHMTSIIGAPNRADQIAPMIKRSGLSAAEFEHLVERIRCRSNEVPDSVARLAGIANANGVPMLSHDDASPSHRRWFRSLGCRLSEFPTNVETAREAADGGDEIILGAPNVVRGGSHTGWTKAADMIECGLCSILASDYYYPAPMLAAFRLAADGILSLERAWPLLSQAPAKAVGLCDRGSIAPGKRADLVLVDAGNAQRPRLVATVSAGRIVHLCEADRLR